MTSRSSEPTPVKGRRFIFAGLALLGALSVVALQGEDVLWQWDPWLGVQGEPIAISHQGSPEDPLKPDLDGFLRAVEDQGYRYLESDVRLIDRTPAQAEDGDVGMALAALHDIDGSTESLAELRASGHNVALVEELLTNPAFDGVRWNFELKGGTIATANELARLLDHADAWDRVCISFGDIKSQQLVGAIRNRLEGTCSCASFPEKSVLFDFEALVILTVPFRKSTGHPVSCVQVLHQFITQSDVDEAHERGIAIHAWEVNLPDQVFGQYLPNKVVDIERMSEQRMIELLDMGIDGIITDDIDLLREVLEARGEWPS